MSKTVKFDAIYKLQEGINTLAEAVGSTLGPNGKEVIIDRGSEYPYITKDGVTVAQEVDLQDPFEKMGADLVKGAAIKTAKEAGDGTTTTTILAATMINGGIKSIDEGYDARKVKEGINIAVDAVREYIKDSSIEVANNIESINQVAYISANNDSSISDLISQAFEKDINCYVTADIAYSNISYLDFYKGAKVDRGYADANFAAQYDDGKIQLINPSVLVYNGRVDDANTLIPAISKSKENGQCLIIFVNDISKTALEALVYNYIRGKINVCVIKSPGMSYNREETLKDISIITGATLIDDSIGNTLANIDENKLGRVNSATISSTYTLMELNEGISSTEIDNRCKEIEDLITNTSDESAKRVLERRLATFKSSIGVIKVGGKSDIEINERKDRVDDAICAIYAAMEEGIVAGGGATYAKASMILHHLASTEEDPSVERGIEIVEKAILKPFNIFTKDVPDVEDVYDSSNRIGYDAKNDKIVDMIEAGIIDPAKVTRVSLENAASVALTIMNTKCIMVDNHDNKSIF